MINAVVIEALKANPAQVIVGDAPVQGCRFDELLRVNGFDKWSEEIQKRDSRFKGIIDFRRTVSVFVNDVRQATENKVPLDQYVLYNLAEDSYLEPITDDKNSFRVTNYDPRLMAKTHSPGNHQYLVARHVIEADVVINLPKLKTHKKAGITNALKNLVGINGKRNICRITASAVRRAAAIVIRETIWSSEVGNLLPTNKMRQIRRRKEKFSLRSIFNLTE